LWITGLETAFLRIDMSQPAAIALESGVPTG
jgi:hypothetical protein